MRPTVGKVLDQIVANLATEILPIVPTSYRQGLVGSQLALLAAVREEFDRGASRRVEENQALRELFRVAAALPLQPDLAERLATAAHDKDDSLLIPDLDAHNDSLRALLVELQTAVEALEGDEARRIENSIWSELSASTERRKLAMSPF